MMDSSSSLHDPLTGGVDGSTTRVPASAAGMMGRIQSSNLVSSVLALRSKLRPWAADFLAPSRFSRPTDDWPTRMKSNVAYYKSNYGVLFLGILVISIITSPVLLISLVILSAAWTFLLTMRPRQDDGSLVPITVGGKTLGGFEQKAALAGITVIAMMASSLGSTLFWALGVSCFAIGVHSILHTTEFHEVDAEDFGGSSAATQPAFASNV